MDQTSATISQQKTAAPPKTLQRVELVTKHAAS